MAFTIGPVIGLVTETEARVMVETTAAARVTLEARRDKTVVARAESHTTRLIPEVVTLSGLSRGVSYQLLITDTTDGDRRTGSFRTINPAASSFRVAALSCNQIHHPARPVAWQRLVRRLAQKAEPVDLVVHLGDQVYGDEGKGTQRSVFQHCLDELRHSAGGPSDWQAREPWITERYREMYRYWWSQPLVRDVLASASNLMIWDDHEVTDDWGDDNRFADRQRPEHYIARGAWRAFHEYQRQLWDQSAVTAPIGGHESFHQVLGHVGILFLDMRGGRGFAVYDREAHHPSTPTPFLGSAQWHAVRAALSGPLHAVRLLIVVCPVPLAYIGPDWIDAYPLSVEDDVRGQWSYRLNQGEQLQMMRTLFNWRDARPGSEVVLVAGDVHVGCKTTLARASDGEQIQQLITSPIQRGSFSALQFQGLQAWLRGSPTAGLGTRPAPSEFTWKASGLVNKPNFGLVTVRFAPRGRSTVTISSA